MKNNTRIGRAFTNYIILVINLLKTTFQLIYGIWKISRLPHPIVTVFGGSRLAQGSLYARRAHELAHMLTANDISVMTGGGPGIMEAANCGAFHESWRYIQKRSLGIGVKGLGSIQERNTCAQEQITLNYFFARKWLLIDYSIAYAVFPGGFGTLDELAEVATLMQTKKLHKAPIVLFGIDYWKPFMDWLYNSALPNGLVTAQEVALLHLTDSVEEAYCLLRDQCSINGYHSGK